MNKHILLVTLILILFSGCSSKTIEVKEALSTITSDKSKAYIIFAYGPPKLLGPTPEALLYEFDPKTNEQKLLIDFDTHGKFVQEVVPGEHYYIIRRVMPTMSLQEDIKYQFTVKAQQGNSIYVDLQGLKVFTPHRELLEKKLQEMSCISDSLHRYGFEEIKEKKKSKGSKDFIISSEKDDNSIKRYESLLLGRIQISCKDDQVIDLSPGQSFFKLSTLTSMKKLPIIKSATNLDNFELLPKDVVKAKYDNFHLLHQDAIQKYTFEIYNYPEKNNKQKYGRVQTVINFSENIDLKDTSNIKQIINDIFTPDLSLDSTGELKVIFNVKNYVSGNRAGRYFAFTHDNALESMTSFQVSAEFVDTASGENIGKVSATRILGGGFFGGSTSGIIEDAVNDIFTYTNAVYIKK